jgi:hypothetical protein
MMDTLTIRMPESLTRQLREHNIAEKTVRQIAVEALQRWLDNHFEQEEEFGDLKYQIRELCGDTPPSDDDIFVDGMTGEEYLALSEEEDKALWDKWYAEELDKIWWNDAEDKVYEIRSSVVPA